jgi:putative tricarboxylic transport membrane protein
LRGVREGTPDLIGAGLLVALGAALSIGSVRYEIFTPEGRIGPGFMPFIVGILLVIFGGMVGVEAWWRRARATRERGEAVAGGEEAAPNRTVVMVFASTLAAILLIPVLGFLASFGLLIFVLVRFVERGSYLSAILVSAGAVAVTWFVFERFLRIPLPQGVFGLVGGG